MSEFTKHKIAFALALWAVLFTLTPFASSLARLSFSVGNVEIAATHAFAAVALLLGLSVYTYAILFLTEKSLRIVEWLAGAFYTLAIIVPPLFFLIYTLAHLIDWLGVVFRDQESAEAAKQVIAVLATILGALVGWFSQKEIQRLERAAESRAAQNQFLGLFERAEELLRSGHPDLAVVEGFRALEGAMRSAMRRKGSDVPRTAAALFDRVVQAEMLSNEWRGAFLRLRQLRNSIAHEQVTVTTDQSEEALRVVAQMLVGLTDFE